MTKNLSERLLGDYSAPQLLFDADGARFVLDPVARFAPGSEGVVDLYLTPSFLSVAIVKRRDGWQVRIDQGATADATTYQSWDEQAFNHTVEWLKREG